MASMSEIYVYVMIMGAAYRWLILVQAQDCKKKSYFDLH